MYIVSPVCSVRDDGTFKSWSLVTVVESASLGQDLCSSNGPSG